MAKTWTIEIGGTSRNYRDINIARKLGRESATEFSATIEYYASINYFDLVEIKRDGTAEWKGYIEDIDIKWDKNGRFLRVYGRDTTLILWKKWGENFSNLHEGTLGFFGSVNANELIKFLLRTPKSDPVHDFPNNKEGWGIDYSKIGTCEAARTSVGDADWVKLRRRGVGWRNSGSPFNTISANVDAVIQHQWNDIGASPWLNANDAAYIYESTIGDTDIYSFQNLSTLAPTATEVNRCYLSVVWQPPSALWGYGAFDIYISPDNGTTWYYVGYVSGRVALGVPNPWRTFTFDVSNIINTVTKADNARVKFICQCSAPPFAQNVNINHSYLSFNYTTGGDQGTNDYFTIPLETTEEITGIYVECRANSNCYARNYVIEKYVAGDPLVWSEIFSSGNFSKWDSSIGWTIDTSPVYYGAYSAGSPWQVGCQDLRKIVGAYNPMTVRFRFYINSMSLPDNGDYVHFCWVGKDPFADWLIRCSIYKNAGVLKWAINGYDNAGGWGPIYQTAGSAPATGQWYEVKVQVFSAAGGAGYVKLYINDVLVVQNTGLTNDTRGPADSIRFDSQMADAGCSGDHNVDAIDVFNGTTMDSWSNLVTVTGNTYRDIIHSWTPQSLSKIRIRITSATANISWCISQIYIYKAETLEYRIWKETNVTSNLTSNAASGQKVCNVVNGTLFLAGQIVTIADNNVYEVNKIASIASNALTMDNNLRNTYTTAAGGKVYRGFPDNQYIHTVTFDASYSNAVGPFNLPKGRLINSINEILDLCHSTYIPYEWWLALDSSNTFHINSQKGSDLSATISFAKGINLGGIEKESSVRDTVQRVQVAGRGEGKRQNEFSSDWQEDKNKMVSAGTFHEEVISKKGTLDKEVGNTLANIYLTEEGNPKGLINVSINNDSYTSMAYDVGDDVTITDALTDTSGTFRIYNIRKEINDSGEQIALAVGSPWQDDADEWADIYRRLKNLELIGVIVDDWMGEATDEGKISTVDALTTTFEKTAKNDEEAAERDLKDPSWYMVPNPSAYTAEQNAFAAGGARGTPAYYDYPNGRQWTWENDWMKVNGPNALSGVQTLLIEMRGDSGEPLNVPVSANPKLVCELKPVWETGGAPKNWYDTDYFEIGIYNSTIGAAGVGFKFRISKIAGQNSCKVETVWNETGNATDERKKFIRNIDMSDVNTGQNFKYRFEIIVDVAAGIVIFNIYDIQIAEEHPTTAVIVGISTISNILRPIYMFMSGDNQGNPNLQARVYIYKLRTEWERIQ